MAARYRYFLVTEDGDVLGTDRSDIAKAAAEDGVTLVIDTTSCTATFDAIPSKIEEAGADEWLGEDPDDEDENEDEA